MDPESSNVVSVAPSHELLRRVYGADYYVKLVRECSECGTIVEENSVSEELLDSNAATGNHLHSVGAQGEDALSPETDKLVIEVAVDQEEAFDSSLVFFPTRESEVAYVDCSLVRTADIFNNQVLHFQKSSSLEEAQLMSVDSNAIEEDDVVTKQIHIASEDFDQVVYETNPNKDSVSDGISEQKPVQVVRSLNFVAESTGIHIEHEDKSQDTEDDRTDGDASIGTDATDEQIYDIQNQELLQPLLDHNKPTEVYSDNDEKVPVIAVSDDNGKADSEGSCEVSIGSEICEQEQCLPLPVQESHPSLTDQEEIELKHAVGEGDEGIERNGEMSNIDSMEGLFKEVGNLQTWDTFPPLSAQLITFTGDLPSNIEIYNEDRALDSEECNSDGNREVSEMQLDHQYCGCELTLSSNAPVLKSEVIEAPEHKEIHHTQPALDIQISRYVDVNNGELNTKSDDAIASDVDDSIDTSEVITEGDGRMLSGNDSQEIGMECIVDEDRHPQDADTSTNRSFQLGQSTGLNIGMGEEIQGDGSSFEDSNNFRIESSETSVGDQLNDAKMTVSCKHSGGSKEAAEEFPSQEGYSQIKIGSSENDTETPRIMDFIENHHQHSHLEDNEMEEEKAPWTPNSEEGIQNHGRLVFEKRDLATESVDGSVASEIDVTEPTTTENLKAALKAERHALRSLYAELEEERSASAIAANQTMAMITRLQEEKASMQMEALQYQRMMEEQSEYDQEALQMLNELVMKREKEKQELEKELEIYRKKLENYEARESSRSGKANGQNGFDSGISGGNESDDEGSYDPNNEDVQDRYDIDKKYRASAEVRLHSAADEEAVEHLISLDESLDDLEEERISTLMQLKELEEKFNAVDDSKVSSQKKLANESGNEHMDLLDEIDETHNNVGTGFSSGFSDDMVSEEKEYRRKHLLTGGRRLLPLFDAAASDNVEGSAQEQPEFSDVSPDSLSKSDTYLNKDVAEEVHNVYERLLALEADREFLKHCIKSLKNGDKGIKLLQEILHHLHDLKSAELQL